jgi:hypothetical protein
MQLRQTLSMQISPSAQLPHATGVPVHAFTIEPQFFPWRVHSFGSGAGLHMLATQVSVARQGLPHESVPPHPSEIVPHCAPIASQVVGMHGLHVLATVSQAEPAPQDAHVSSPPQPSGTFPHRPSHVFGTQSSHCPVDPLHTLPVGHDPQSNPLPHASARTPQAALAIVQAPPRSTHVCAVTSQTLPAAHTPQRSIPPHLFGMDPQLTPSAAHVVGVQIADPPLPPFPIKLPADPLAPIAPPLPRDPPSATLPSLLPPSCPAPPAPTSVEASPPVSPLDPQPIATTRATHPAAIRVVHRAMSLANEIDGRRRLLMT